LAAAAAADADADAGAGAGADAAAVDREGLYTAIWRPLNMHLFITPIAYVAASSSSNSTNPYPRDWPLC
jgi:hypothetical protein